MRSSSDSSLLLAASSKASSTGRSIIWGGADGTSHYASIGTSHTSSDLSILSGLKLSSSGDVIQYSHTGTYAPIGMSFDLSSGDILFFSESSGSKTKGSTFNSTSNQKMKLDVNGKVFLSGGISTGGEANPDTASNGICVGAMPSNGGRSFNVKVDSQTHGMTNNDETDTFFSIYNSGEAQVITSYSNTLHNALTLNSVAFDSSNLNQRGHAPLRIISGKKGTYSGLPVSSTENLVSVENIGALALMIKGNGGIYQELTTESLEIKDAGSTGATEQDYIEVEIGGTTGYIRVHATK